MQVSTFCEKLNKVDGNIHVVEEEIHLTNGVYEAELQHDNINEATFAVFTGPKLTGSRLESYTLSTPSLAPWKRIVRVYADVPVVYISYETDGDTVEGDDINRVQAAIVATQEALNAEEGRAQAAEGILRIHVSDMDNPHAVTKSQIGLGKVENKSGSEIRSEMTKEEVVAALGYTPPETNIGYTHPDSGVMTGTYRSVTVDAQGHVTAGSNPALTWNDLKGA